MKCSKEGGLVPFWCISADSCLLTLIALEVTFLVDCFSWVDTLPEGSTRWYIFVTCCWHNNSATNMAFTLEVKTQVLLELSNLAYDTNQLIQSRINHHSFAYLLSTISTHTWDLFIIEYIKFFSCFYFLQIVIMCLSADYYYINVVFYNRHSNVSTYVT